MPDNGHGMAVRAPGGGVMLIRPRWREEVF